MRKITELTPEQLCFTCDESVFNFETTATVPQLEMMIGQERAVKAVEFGLRSKVRGYNIFVAGPVGTGKITYARAAVSRVAAKEAAPEDWCYVNNFENHGQPLALSLPAGRGSIFRNDMQELLDNLKREIPKVFSGEDYEQAKGEIVKDFQAKRATVLEAFNQQAERQDISPQWTSTGFLGVPMRNGVPMTQEDFQKLPKNERDIYEKKLMAIHERAIEVVRQVQLLEQQAREEVRKLDTTVGLYAAGHYLEDLKVKYKDFEKIIAYLEAVLKDVVQNIGDFKPVAEEDEEENPMLAFRRSMTENGKNRYGVNLFVNNSECEGAPVIVETNPTYYNLVGRVEYETRMGVGITDYSMIKAGALQRANGGYLILNVRDVLSNMGAWEGLKRALKTQKALIENLGEQYGMVAMSSLKPEAIDVDVKVLLVGNPTLYHLLYNYDEDFRKLFRIFADFDVEMPNNALNIQRLAGFIATSVKRDNLKHFHRSAVARLVEQSTRMAGRQERFSTRFSDLVEILCEANTWAEIDNSQIVTAAHVEKAIREKRYRSNQYEEKLQEMFAEGKYLMDTATDTVGQVNGLAVLSVGEYTFGKPSRITATTFLGRSGVLNIERETRMSGTTHSKGVLILSGYMGDKYAQKYPLALTASITFEQLYGGIDGDSASSTELYAILSSLAEAPIHQGIAVTGSVNQKGEIQPIGGATEKIEGFFDICKMKGLTGKQGVMIPHQNVGDLTLNQDVVDAVSNGSFHIYPVKTIDEGIEILTGIPAGKPGRNGKYPPDTIHGKVEAKLRYYHEMLMEKNKEKISKNEKKEKSAEAPKKQVPVQ